MERPVPADAGIAGFPMAEPAWAGLALAKKLLEGLRIVEVTLVLGPKMPLDACPLGWRVCIVPVGWLILGTVVLIGLLGLREIGLLVTVGA